MNLDSVLFSDSSWNTNLQGFSVGSGDNDFTREGKLNFVLFCCWQKHLVLISFEYPTFKFSEPSSVPMRQGTFNFKLHLTFYSFLQLIFKHAIAVPLDDSFRAVIIFVTLFWTLVLQCPFERVMACAECNILDETVLLFHINHAISSLSPSCGIFILTICFLFRASGATD